MIVLLCPRYVYESPSDPFTVTSLSACQSAQADHPSQTTGAPQKQEACLESVLDQLPQCVFRKDVNAVYMGCNQPWAAVVGLADPAAIVGKTDHDLPWAAGEADRYRARDRQLLLAGEPELHHLTSRLKATGEQLWFDASRVPLVDESGQVLGLLCTFENITERQQAADKLNQSAKLLQLVLDNIPQAIFWKDRQSVYLGCDQNWAQAAGLSPLQAVAGKTDFELCWTPEEAALYCEQDQQVMETALQDSSMNHAGTGTSQNFR